MTDLAKEQKLALKLCDEGKNVFITGPGGTGKSLLIKILHKSYPTKEVRVCALTGVAAELIGCHATTIHSWAGTGISKGTEKQIIKNINQKDKHKNWLKTDVLIVDEVSMMSKKYFELLDSIGRKIRGFNVPFGGIQVIFLGDFYQLPPVGDKSDHDTSKFCFESEIWKQTFNESVILTKIFRQKDREFTKILNSLRKGKISREGYDILMRRHIKNESLVYEEDTPIISPVNRVVKRINKERMNKLSGISYKYEYSFFKNDDYDIETPYSIEKLAKNSLLAGLGPEREFELKIGSKVMCVSNLILDGEKQLVNGSQGVVTNFSGGIPVVTYKNGLVKTMDYHTKMSDDIEGLGIKQIPLILSWAITIHKSQGITLESAIVDAGSNIFADGQMYVGLSRVKSLDGLILKDFNRFKILVNEKVKKFYANLKEEEKRKREEREEREEREREKEEEMGDSTLTKDEFFKDCGIDEIPEDLSLFYDNYDKKIYRKICIKYHPDKSDFHNGYIQAINKIKDIHNPKVHKNDETWTK